MNYPGGEPQVPLKVFYYQSVGGRESDSYCSVLSQHLHMVLLSHKVTPLCSWMPHHVQIVLHSYTVLFTIHKL